MQIYNKSAKNHMILSCHPFQVEKVAHLFETKASSKNTNSLPGRGQIQFIEVLNHHFVRRQYKRGGLMRYFLKEWYLYRSKKSTRAWCELYLLAYLHESGFPVPTPVACRVQRHGFFYTADLIMLEIPNAHSLSQLLVQNGLSEEIWYRIGKMIRRFHDAGINHADLNAHNIMIDAQQKIWLIDFDRCSIKSSKKTWKKRNLKRLENSLIKLRREKGICFSNANWLSLMEGYAPKQA